MAEPARLTASARVLLADPQQMMRRLCDHFAEYGEVSMRGRHGSIETSFGIARIEVDATALSLSAEGRDETGLAYVKLSMAEHILAFAAAESPKLVWTGDAAAGQPLPYFREMTVVGASTVTPHMRRIRLRGDNLARFASGGMHVRLLFQPEGATRPVWPVTGEDGRPSWPQGEAKPLVRIYTIRSIDVAKGEVEIDFVLHHDDGGSPGARFASRARPGDRVGMTGPGGGGIGEADWYLLAGDETALPAIARILETLPEAARAVVRIEVADAGEEQDLRSAAALDLRWLHRNGRPAGTTTLLQDAVRTVDWPADADAVFAWAGCEHAAYRAIRRHLREDKGLGRTQHMVAAYWRRGLHGDSL